MLLDVLRYAGPAGLAHGLYRRLVHPVAPIFQIARPYCEGKIGLEIGGPSRCFSRGHYVPIYPIARRVDNCNFSSETVWEGSLEEHGAFSFDPSKEPGTQYIREAADLFGISDETYGFVLSSHMLEHGANPIKVLREWMRVLEPGGCLVLILPHVAATFDRDRPITTLAHLHDDFESDVGEDDPTHVDEFVRHGPKRFPGMERHEAVAKLRENRRYRMVHHHVFDTRLVVDTVDHAGFDVRAAARLRPNSILCLATKSDVGERAGPPAQE